MKVFVFFCTLFFLNHAYADEVVERKEIILFVSFDFERYWDFRRGTCDDNELCNHVKPVVVEPVSIALKKEVNFDGSMFYSGGYRDKSSMNGYIYAWSVNIYSTDMKTRIHASMTLIETPNGPVSLRRSDRLGDISVFHVDQLNRVLFAGKEKRIRKNALLVPTLTISSTSDFNEEL